MSLKIVLLHFFVLSICYGWSNETKFDWSTILNAPPGCDQTNGNQILHFKSQNKPYWENEQGLLFVNSYLKEAEALTSDAEVLKFGSDQVQLNGLFIELGVCTGKTVNFIAALNPHQKIYGFDSFEGLPEDWIKGEKVIAKIFFPVQNV